MRAERHDAISRLEVADDRSRFVAEADDVHGTPGDPRRFPFDQPYAGTLARIEERTDRYLQRRGRPAVRNLDGDGRAQWRVCQPTLQHVPSLERPSLTVGSVRHLAGGDEVAVSHLVLRGLVRARPCGGNGFLVRAHGESQVRGIDTHERLAASDGLPRINQAFQDLPGDSEPQVALHAGRDDAGKRTLRLDGDLDSLDPYQRRLGPWVS